MIMNEDSWHVGSKEHADCLSLNKKLRYEAYERERLLDHHELLLAYRSDVIRELKELCGRALAVLNREMPCIADYERAEVWRARENLKYRLKQVSEDAELGKRCPEQFTASAPGFPPL
jgi:hypothetical protein